MKFLNLNLKAVGPFTGANLDLSAGSHGLHLIYGPNEAGKTSALRALSYLLFGFPGRTPDDFVHPYDQLRVGATLQHSDGEVLEFVRRKGNKNVLRGADDTAVVPPERLERFLGGLDQAGFETLFGIDHARLTRAGEEIRTGQGRLGELLFAAGTGLAGLRQAQERLQEQLDALYRPRGQNPRINHALAEFRAGQDELKKLQLPSETWVQHDRAHRDALERAAEFGDKIAAQSAARNRLERIRAAVTLTARRRSLLESLAVLGEVVRLRDDFGSDRRTAEDRLQLAQHNIQQAGATLDDLDARLAGLIVPHPLLDAAEDIEALRENLGAIVKARKDRPTLEHYKAEHEHQARRLLRELGRSKDLAAVESFRLRADEPAVIRSLAKQAAAFEAKREKALEAISRLEAQVTALDRRQGEQASPRAIEPLRHAFRHARQAGDLDDRLAQARTTLDRCEKAATRALAQLPGWKESLDSLEQLAVPLDATIERLETAIQQAENSLAALDDKHAGELAEIGRLDAKIQALALENDVPTEADLQSSRRLRDQGWQIVRSTWLETSGRPPEAAAFIAEAAPGRPLADAFEQTQNQADSVSDRLRREAGHVTRKAEWIAQLALRRTSLESTSAARDQSAHRLKTLAVEWSALAEPLNVPSATPAELRAWLRRRDDVVQLAAQIRAARQAVEPLAIAHEDHRRALERALDALDESPGKTARLGELLARAEDLLETEEKAARAREKDRSKAEESRGELARERLALRDLDDEREGWRSLWSEKMARLGLEPTAAPEQAEVVLDKIQELFDETGRLRGFASRLQGMDRDDSNFAASVAALAERVAPDLAQEPAEPLARTLAERLRDARGLREQQATLSQERIAEDRRLRDTETVRDAANLQLRRLCQEAGCDVPADLPDAETRSASRARLEDALQDCEAQLLAQSAGAGLESFVREVEQADADQLDTQIERLEIDLADLRREWETVNRTVGAEKTELERMDGQSLAATAAETLQTTLARLQGDVGRYAALRVASVVLQRGIDRYREKNQGPVLSRASVLFAGLTVGSFVRLQIDDDGAGAVVKGVRPDGRLVGVEAMSDGSHDQLYLALRLASLESWLRSHEPVPFIVDDILLNFDDRRAIAALRALAELSERTQVLFFTHHRHLADLALENLPKGVALIHELPVREGTPPAAESNGTKRSPKPGTAEARK